MKKKILVGILVLTMLVACLGVTALATEGGAESVEVKEGTAEALQNAINNVKDGGTVKLMVDVTDITSSIKILADSKTVNVAKNLTIDLNGFKITGKVDNGGLIQLINRAASKKATLTITDNSSKDTKGTIENTGSNQTIYLWGAKSADKTADVELNLQNGVSIVGQTAIFSYAVTTVNITKATVKGTTTSIDLKSGDSLTIQDGTFYGPLSVQTAMGETPATRSIKGGSFSVYNDSVTQNLETGYGVVDVTPDAQGVNLYKIGKSDALKETAEASVQLTESEDSTIYGTLQQLVDLYKGRTTDGTLTESKIVTFKVLKDAKLTLTGFGGENNGTFVPTNTLKFEISKDAKLTLTATGTKVAKFVFIGAGVANVTNTITAANGYKVTTDNDTHTTTCDLDPEKVDVLAEVKMKDGKIKYLTAENIKSFFGNGITKDVDTITLKHDYKLSSTIDIPEQADITIDMGGHTLTSNIAKGGMALKSTEGGTVTLKNGTFDASVPGTAISLGVTASNGGDPQKPVVTDTKSNGKAVIGEGAVIKGTIGVFNKDSELTMEAGSSVEAEGFAIAGNGAHDGTKITIKNGASVKSTGTAAIYHPQGGTLTIGEENSTVAAPVIVGAAGVVVRDGEVKVNDADITATSDGPIKVGDADTTVPAGGIVLDIVEGYSSTSTKKVEIEDANVTAQDGQPAVSYTKDGDKVEAKDIPANTVTASGGTYSTPLETKFLDPNLRATVTDEANGTTSYFQSTAAAKEFAEEKGLEPEPIANAKDLADLHAAGIIPTGMSSADAKAMLKEQLIEAGLTDAEATDILSNVTVGEDYFYAVVKGAKGDETTGKDYTVEFKFGEKSHKMEIKVKKAGVVCFKPAATGTGDITSIEPGVYKVALTKDSTPVFDPPMPLYIYKIVYKVGTGVKGNEEHVYTDRKFVFEAKKSETPKSFTLNPDVNKWTYGLQEQGEYLATVTIGGVYASPIDPGHKCPTKGFKDMEVYDTSKLWYHEAMDYMVLNGYIQGFPGNTLQPNGISTRAQLWVIMAQTKGVEVKSNPWYKLAKKWAEENKYSDGLRPDDPIQREEIVAILWRMAGEPKSTKALTSFGDAASVNDWAKTAMAWAVEKGIISGRTDENGKPVLVPQGIANRAELAVLIYNYVTLMK